jgi:hypothetical protein
MAKNEGVFRLIDTSKTRDLPHFVRTTDMLYQKEKDSATDNGDQSNLPDADSADIGNAYNNDR